MIRVFSIKHYVREQIFDLGCYCNPLVPAILEKNVWEKEKYGLSYYKKESQTLEFRLIGKTYGWTLRCGNKDLIKKVEFVNQLQHLLFGLGINHKMEV